MQILKAAFLHLFCHCTKGHRRADTAGGFEYQNRQKPATSGRNRHAAEEKPKPKPARPVLSPANKKSFSALIRHLASGLTKVHLQINFPLFLIYFFSNLNKEPKKFTYFSVSVFPLPLPLQSVLYFVANAHKLKLTTHRTKAHAALHVTTPNSNTPGDLSSGQCGLKTQARGTETAARQCLCLCSNLVAWRGDTSILGRLLGLGRSLGQIRTSVQLAYLSC